MNVNVKPNDPALPGPEAAAGQHILNKQELAALLEVNDKCRVCGSEGRLRQLIIEVGGMVGAERCLGLFVDKRTRKNPHGLFFINAGYPEATANSYLEHARKAVGADGFFNFSDRFVLKQLSKGGILGAAPAEVDGVLPDDIGRGFACGVCEGSPGERSLYLFGNEEEKNSRRASAILGCATPHLHSAWRALLDKNRQEELCALTSQERKVLAGLREGMNDGEIAGTMDITGFTVRFHMKNIMRKLNAKNRVSALVAALRKGELEL